MIHSIQVMISLESTKKLSQVWPPLTGMRPTHVPFKSHPFFIFRRIMLIYPSLYCASDEWPQEEDNLLRESIDTHLNDQYGDLFDEYSPIQWNNVVDICIQNYPSFQRSAGKSHYFLTAHVT